MAIENNYGLGISWHWTILNIIKNMIWTALCFLLKFLSVRDTLRGRWNDIMSSFGLTWNTPPFPIPKSMWVKEMKKKMTLGVSTVWPWASDLPLCATAPMWHEANSKIYFFGCCEGWIKLYGHHFPTVSGAELGTFPGYGTCKVVAGVSCDLQRADYPAFERLAFFFQRMPVFWWCRGKEAWVTPVGRIPRCWERAKY